MFYFIHSLFEWNLVAKLSQSLVDSSQLLGLDKKRLALGLDGSLLLSMVSLGALFALVLQASQNTLVFPANLSAQALQGAEAATRLQADNTQGSRDNHALHGGVRLGDSLKDLHTLQSSSTTGSLVGEHTANSAPENFARGTEVVRALAGIRGRLLAKEGVVLELVAEEGPGDVEFFATDDDDALAGQQLLGNDGCEAAEQVALSINNDDLFEGH